MVTGGGGGVGVPPKPHIPPVVDGGGGAGRTSGTPMLLFNHLDLKTAPSHQATKPSSCEEAVRPGTVPSCRPHHIPVPCPRVNTFAVSQ